MLPAISGVPLWAAASTISSRRSASADIAAAAADLAGVLIAEHHRAPRRGQRAFHLHRHQALLDQGAVFGARGQLLADVAALLPVDAMELVESRLQQDRLLHREIAAAVGNAQ